MTAQEMQYHFELKLNQFHSIEKSFTSTDIAVFLNLAQDQLIDDRYSKKVGSIISFFESDEKTRMELGSLIANHIVNTGSFDTTNIALHPNALFVVLPNNYLYSLQEMSVVSYSDCNNDVVTGSAKVVPIRHDEYESNIDNPYGKPYRKLIWRMDYGSTGAKKHELIHGSGETISSYKLRYLRKPTSIDINNGVDCELNNILHEEIVDRAILIALAMISELKNTQTKKESNG
jgi:hypothetical protein